MSKNNFNWDLTIVIPRLSCLFSIAKAVLLTVDLVNSDTSGSVDTSNFAMCAFASKCFPIEQVPCSDGWRRTWWQTLHMMAGRLVSLIPWCKLNRHKGACLELFEAIESFESTFREVQQASNMIWRVRSFKSQIQTRSLLEDIITSRNEVSIHFESDMALGIWSLCNTSWVTVTSFDIVK